MAPVIGVKTGGLTLRLEDDMCFLVAGARRKGPDYR
jgi:hypothetical protein